MVSKCDENAYDTWKALIEKYEVSDETQERLNEVTNRWNNCKIRNTSLDPDILFIEIYNLNLNFKKIKERYEKDEDELKRHVFECCT